MDSLARRTINKLLTRPVDFAHKLGWSKLTEIHNEWMVDMLTSTENSTLQAHRGSYKTTCVSVVLLIYMITMPDLKIAFFRKTDDDVKEIVEQVSKMLKNEFVRNIVYAIWGVPLEIVVDNAMELDTNLSGGAKGASQLTAMGIKGSITGKHYDRIFTDDIVTIVDYRSEAEREFTKQQYQELMNLLNREPKCKIYNTGTPWHEDDAFKKMPVAKRYPVSVTGLISEEERKEIKRNLTPYMYAVNYELKYIADEDLVFVNPVTGYDSSVLQNTRYCHIDAAYEGKDYTAFTIGIKKNGKYYLFGKLWRKHVDDCVDQIIMWRKYFKVYRIYCEDNGDHGYLAKALRKRGEVVTTYHESVNKIIKISTELKFNWKNVVFVEGTDEAYIDQIEQWTEEAEHDDAPDSASCLVRIMSGHNEKEYKSAFGY